MNVVSVLINSILLFVFVIFELSAIANVDGILSDKEKKIYGLIFFLLIVLSLLAIYCNI